LHDLRRTVASRLAKPLGVPPHVIEDVLGHRGGYRAKTAGRVYIQNPYEREVRNALALWEDHLRALITGGERKILHMPR
jgi:hypothetical protein